ncbi:MAG: PEP-CTERM sorting domain-containing protein [Kiritimatiellae bacterium]|nr:PEP-CTERM sorting domain-containing protein [Kiritimatiellia bacterium]
MKTLKFIVAAAAAIMLGSAMAAEDSYLYWMVSNAHYYEEPGYSIQFDYATISVDDGTTYLSPAVASDETRLSSDGGVYSGLFDSVNVKSFLVELWDNSTDDRVGWMRYSASSLKDHFYQNAGAHGEGSPFMVSQVVPEPTSGVLLLLGMGGLALRRRKMA